MMQSNSRLGRQQIESFVAKHRLPDTFFELIDNHYSPLAEWVVRMGKPGKTLFLGINGAQGTGKSTLADYLRLVLDIEYDRNVAVLSIDDFYLTKAERSKLAENVHPLLVTRGVPGTHDVQMLADYIERLRALEPGNTMTLPRFDKACDDRARPDTWPTVTGPIDLIILEGWCVGSQPQSEESLSRAINTLEEHQDESGGWRRYVNEQLQGSYAELFTQLDALVFLRAPNFDAIYQWRGEQEQKLAENTHQDTVGIMSNEQIAYFIQHYERLTRANLETLPATADVVLELGNDHDCVRSCYARAGADLAQ
jgi:D-glycerate 3-kinase